MAPESLLTRIEILNILHSRAAVDEDGVTVQEMLGLILCENMNILGSAGVDVADPDSFYYIEVVGEFEPGVADIASNQGFHCRDYAKRSRNSWRTLYGEDSEDGDYSEDGEDSGVDDFDGDDQGGEVIDNNDDQS